MTSIGGLSLAQNVTKRHFPALFCNTQTEQNLKFGHRRALELLKNVETCYLTEALLNCKTNYYLPSY